MLNHIHSNLERRMKMEVEEYIVAVDTGGTFTDCVIVNSKGQVTVGKSHSTRRIFRRGSRIRSGHGRKNRIDAGAIAASYDTVHPWYNGNDERYGGKKRGQGRISNHSRA